MTNGKVKASIESLGPSTIEAEEAALGAVIITPSTLADVAAIVEPDDFFEVKHRWIFDAMLALDKQRMPIDNITLVEELRKRGQLQDIGGSAYITYLINRPEDSFAGPFYAAQVADAALRRRVMGAAGAIAQMAREGRLSREELLSSCEVEIMKAGGRAFDTSWITMPELMTDYFETVEARYHNQGALLGLSTGFLRLDEMLDGLDRTRMYVLAARPGMGKTALMLNIALAAAYQRRGHVHITSLEMGPKQLADRITAFTTGISSKTLKRGTLDADGWSLFAEAAGRLSDLPIVIERVPYISPKLLRLSALRAKREHELALVCVDYLQLMQPDKRSTSRYQDVTDVSRSLKLLALELEVPVLALAQLNRQNEQRADKRPQLSDLRDSGAIEQDADVVMFLHSPDDTQDNRAGGVYAGAMAGGGAGSSRVVKPPVLRNAELIVAKQRDGEMGTIPMTFDGAIQLFREV